MIDIGVRWQPDAIKIVNYVGHIGLLMLCFLMGALIKKTNTTEGRKPIVELTNFMILLQMISLPVGNFVSISSANRLIAFSLSIYWLWKIFINKRITLK